MLNALQIYVMSIILDAIVILHNVSSTSPENKRRWFYVEAAKRKILEYKISY